MKLIEYIDKLQWAIELKFDYFYIGYNGHSGIWPTLGKLIDIW